MIDTAPLRRKLLDLAITGKLVPRQGEWQTVKLEDLCVKIGAGSTPRGGKSVYVAQGVKFLREQNIYCDGIHYDGIVYISEEVNNAKKGSQVFAKDILMNITGGSIGRTALVPDDFDVANVNQHVLIIRLKNLDYRQYVHLCLCSPKFTNLMFERQTGDKPGLSAEKVKKFPIPLPPIAEQKAIVKRLEELLKLEGEIAAESAALDDLITAAKRKVLDLAIRGKLVSQDSADEPASELLKRIAAKRETQVSTDRRGRNKGSSVIFRGADRSAYETCDGKTVCIDDEIPFDIPDSWAWARLGAFISIIAGVSYQKGDVTTTGVRILRGGNIKEDAHICLNNEDVFLSQQYADPSTAIRKGDVVIVASTGSSTVIGRPAIASEDMPSVQIGAFLRILRAKDGSSREWLPVIVLGDYYREHIREQSKGTSIKNLKAKYLDEMLIPLPPLAEQRRIVAKIEEVRELMQSLTR